MDEREQLQRAMTAMEAQRGVLSDAVVDAALAAFREKLISLDRPVEAPGAAAARPAQYRRARPVSPPLAAPLTGRDKERSQLYAAFSTAVAARGLRSVILTGDPGLGKTRLARELIAGLETSQRPFALLEGRGDWQRNRRPYALLREMLARLFQITEKDTSAAAREKILSGVESWQGCEEMETAHWLGHLTGYNFPHSPFLNGRLDDPRRARQLAFHSLNRFLAAIAQRKPLILLADDLQWTDDGSLDWLDTLARSEPGRPLVLLCLSRPALFERRPNWGERWPNHTRLELSSLTDAQSVTLAGQLLRAGTRPLGSGSAGFPPDEVLALPAQYIGDQAGGNPFLVCELAQLVVEDGVLVQGSLPGEPAWRVDANRLAEHTLPGSLVEAIQLRLDSLPPGEREVLLRAAVVGPVFWEGAVQALLDAAPCPGGPEAELLRALNLPGVLESLQDHGMITRHAVSAFDHSSEYEFNNALLYEVAYESQQVRRRRQDHARVAVWLAAQSSERVEVYAAIIARHYEQAEERPLAADWYGLAAMQARQLSAPEGAVRYYSRALELLPDEPGYFDQRVQFYKSLWEVQWWQARYIEALATGQALLAAAEARGDRTIQAMAWNRIAAVQTRQGEYPASLRSVQRAERLARSAGESREVALALFNRGMTLYRLGDAAAALQAGEQALAFNQSTLGQEGTSAAVDLPAGADLPTMPELPAAARQAVDRPAPGDLPGKEAAKAPAQTVSRDLPTQPRGAALESARERARILNLLALINQRAGRYTEADNDYRQVLAVHRECGDRSAMVAALNSLGANAQMQGDFQTASRYFEEALSLTRELGYHELELVCLSYLAGARVELGEYEQAETGLRDVLRRTEGGTWFLLDEVYRGLALACLGQNRGDEALAAGLRALDLARKSRSGEHTGRAWRTLGRIASRYDHAIPATASGCPEGSTPVLVDDRPCSAHTCYAASLQIFVEMGAASEQARTVREWAGYELEHGDRREGVRLWQEARDLFSRLGLNMEVERMDRLAAARSDPG